MDTETGQEEKTKIRVSLQSIITVYLGLEKEIRVVCTSEDSCHINYEFTDAEIGYIGKSFDYSSDEVLAHFNRELSEDLNFVLAHYNPELNVGDFIRVSEMAFIVCKMVADRSNKQEGDCIIILK